MRRPSITRTCGGDPEGNVDVPITMTVLPAHAGVIRKLIEIWSAGKGITRTCGGDPMSSVIVLSL